MTETNVQKREKSFGVDPRHLQALFAQLPQLEAASQKSLGTSLETTDNSAEMTALRAGLEQGVAAAVGGEAPDAGAAPAVTAQSSVEVPGPVSATVSEPATVPTVSAPALSKFLADKPEEGKGWTGFVKDFLNDPATIKATIFGLAALNSTADNPAGAFIEGLGAVGSAYGAQRTRMQQEFENQVSEEGLRQSSQRVATEKFGVEQKVATDKSQLALDTEKLRVSAQSSLQDFDLRKAQLVAGLEDKALDRQLEAYRDYNQAKLNQLQLVQQHLSAQDNKAYQKATVDLQRRGQDRALMNDILDASVALSLGELDAETKKTTASAGNDAALKASLFKTITDQYEAARLDYVNPYQGTIDQYMAERLPTLRKVFAPKDNPWINKYLGEIEVALAAAEEPKPAAEKPAGPRVSINPASGTVNVPSITGEPAGKSVYDDTIVGRVFRSTVKSSKEGGNIFSGETASESDVAAPAAGVSETQAAQAGKTERPRFNLPPSWSKKKPGDTGTVEGVIFEVNPDGKTISAKQ